MAFFLQKTWRAGLINLKFFMKTQEVSRKKTSQNNFLSAQPFIVKMQFEIWKYLPSKLFLPKYLSCRLHNSVQLVPRCFILLYCCHCSQSPAKYTESWYIDGILITAISHQQLNLPGNQSLSGGGQVGRLSTISLACFWIQMFRRCFDLWRDVFAKTMTANVHLLCAHGHLYLRWINLDFFNLQF